MAKISKRTRAIREQVEPGKVYVIEEALELLKKLSNVKFSESVDVAIRLGVDPRKSDQNVRRSTVLPNGTGKQVRVAVFTQGENAEKALEAGADAMRVVGKLGQLLGPRGLMPNPKVGTVSTDVAAAVKNAKAGQVRFRTDKGGIIHSTIGKVDFEVDALAENLTALVNDLLKLKPASSKGTYLKKVAVSTTMGPGLMVDHTGLKH